jgi:hypothetical protein
MIEVRKLTKAYGSTHAVDELVIEAGLSRLDSVVRWLDAADGRLKRAAVEPARAPAYPLPKLRRTVGAQR